MPTIEQQTHYRDDHEFVEYDRVINGYFGLFHRCKISPFRMCNTGDEKSDVSKKASQGEKRAYHSLHVLNTRPAITYLAQVNRSDEESHA